MIVQGRNVLIAYTLTVAIVLAGGAHAQSGAQLLDGMGSYSHPIRTTSPEAQRYFDQGLALLYNFNHAEAERSFLEAAELDPKAPMPWWGVGIARLRCGTEGRNPQSWWRAHRSGAR
jgi:hypothetical protein